QNRYALTDSGYTQDNGDNPGTFKVYGITDRAVYRPAQTVYYRQMLMRRQGGEWKAVAGQPVRVDVTDPKGTVIHTEQQTSNEFGSVSGQLRISSEAPLGEYYVHCYAPLESRGPTELGGNRFRVEEYKKPEFQVSVEPAADRVRLGQPTSATVKASYYFGGPVPNAKVTYRVYRNYWVQRYTFPRPFDFLYRYWNSGDYDSSYRNGEVVAQGEASTDAQGEAKIRFETKTDGTRWGGHDIGYTVEADVQDSSRRVISGTGMVKATRHDVAVFMDYPHGYASKGDTLKIEIVTLNPADAPVSVPGAARVYRMPEHPNGERRLVHEEPLKTDRHGRAYLAWTAREGGYYTAEFETKDSAGEKVTGNLALCVQGPELENGRFRFQGIQLRVENPYYEEGQTAKVLLTTPEPDCAVLLTREANNEILAKQLLRVKGRSLELQIPLTRREVPNVYLQAVMVRGGQPYQATVELFVPPVRQFAAISVQADKERYEPGQKARFTLQAKDWQGRPLRTELSVAVTDASLNYIQKDYAPDIRLYFHGDRRSMSIQQNTSQWSRINPAVEDSQKHESFKTHEWLLPEGMGQLEDWPGKVAGGYYGRLDVSWYYGYRDRGLAMNGFGYGGGGFGGALGPAAPMSASAPSGLAVSDRVARMPAITGAVDRVEQKAREEEPAQPQTAPVRTRFADTAFWTPAVRTDARGTATVEVTWPDNLTQWRAVAVGGTTTAQVGSGETKVRTKKDLLVRLQAPRFFVERDEVTVTANVHNYLSKPARVKVRLELGDSTAEPAPGSTAPETWVEVAKDGEQRVDWTLRVMREGSLRLKVAAQSPSAADATELSFPVIVHGVERQVAQSGVLRKESQAQLAIELPRARKPGSSELVVQLNPSLGAVMLDALPYLADYPYGCIEQTMSRFLPSAVVAKTLKDAGYNLEQLRERARRLEEKEREGDRARPGGRTVENSPYSYPKGRPGTLRLRELPRYYHRWTGPVWDSAQLKAMVLEGLARVRTFQREDGGWGWWPGDSSDPYMTAYVLYGLMTARDAGYTVEDGMLQRGLHCLRGRFLEDDNFHRMAYEARVLAMDPASRDAIRPLTTGRLWERRERLSAYSKALLALALHQVGDAEKAKTLLRNIETTARIDDANGTASWADPDGCWWRWYNNKVETNAAVLQAYLAVEPEAKLPPMMVKWLVNNRRGNAWYSTRETAMAVYALADYVRVNKELAPEYTLKVDLGGKVQRTYTVNRENALFFDNQFIVPDELLDSGTQTLTLSKDGPGALYYSAYTNYFSLEEPIRATGNEISVQRKYYRLIPGTASGQPEYQPAEEDRPNPFLTGRYELLTEGGTGVYYEDPGGGPRY
ncbi:MAG TPA: alpha-2-macroglobulin family protein, partial [Armatimonadota bacterium]|nr:alpha-2-macroglobulin family protein [Armatimonadota bacterium]